MDNKQTKINLDASKLPTMTCQHCGNYTFASSFVIKRVSALISPTGKETLAPIQIFTCLVCAQLLPIGGNDAPDFLADVREKEAVDKSKENERTAYGSGGSKSIL